MVADNSTTASRRVRNKGPGTPSGVTKSLREQYAPAPVQPAADVPAPPEENTRAHGKSALPASDGGLPRVSKSPLRGWGIDGGKANGINARGSGEDGAQPLRSEKSLGLPKGVNRDAALSGGRADTNTGVSPLVSQPNRSSPLPDGMAAPDAIIPAAAPLNAPSGLPRAARASSPSLYKYAPRTTLFHQLQSVTSPKGLSASPPGGARPSKRSPARTASVPSPPQPDGATASDAQVSAGDIAEQAPAVSAVETLARVLTDGVMDDDAQAYTGQGQGVGGSVPDAGVSELAVRLGNQGAAVDLASGREAWVGVGAAHDGGASAWEGKGAMRAPPGGCGVLLLSYWGGNRHRLRMKRASLGYEGYVYSGGHEAEDGLDRLSLAAAADGSSEGGGVRDGGSSAAASVDEERDAHGTPGVNAEVAAAAAVEGPLVRLQSGSSVGSKGRGTPRVLLQGAAQGGSWGSSPSSVTAVSGAGASSVALGGSLLSEMHVGWVDGLRIHGTPPKGRAGHALVQLGTRAFMIGGASDDGAYFGDVWEFNAETMSWTERLVTGDRMPPGAYHSATLLPADASVTADSSAASSTSSELGGGHPKEGQSREGHARDIQAREGPDMRGIADAGSYSAPASGCSGSRSPPPAGPRAGARVLVLGGWQGTRCSDAVFMLEGLETSHPAPLVWRAVTTHAAASPPSSNPSARHPCPRAMHSACVVGRELLVFGGWRGGTSFIGDLSWLARPQTAAAQRGDTSAFASGFGGLRAANAEPSIGSASSGPGPRGGHTATALGRCMYVFGGQAGGPSAGPAPAALHIFDVDTSRWSSVPAQGGLQAPSPRSGHVAVAWGARHLLLFGGFDGTRAVADLYCLDTGTRAWERLATPAGAPVSRSGHAAALMGSRVLVAGGWSEAAGFMADVHALDTVAPYIIDMSIAGGPYNSSLFRISLTLSKGSSPVLSPSVPLRVQWYRSKSGAPFVRIPGARGMAYLPNADDINARVGASCIPCAPDGVTPLGPTFFAATRPLLLDPELGKIVKGLLGNAFAEFEVRLLEEGGRPGKALKLMLSRDTVKLKEGSTTHVKDGYNDQFKVILSSRNPHNFVLHVAEGVSVPLAVTHMWERDLLALAARGFWALVISSHPRWEGPASSRSRGSDKSGNARGDQGEAVSGDHHDGAAMLVYREGKARPQRRWLGGLLKKKK
eukprot:jgi/Mesvir1/27128/Mv20802-RA.1